MSAWWVIGITDTKLVPYYGTQAKADAQAGKVNGVVAAGPFPARSGAQKWIDNFLGTGSGGGPSPGHGGPPPSGTALQAVIAQAARASIGHCYTWGGAPGPSGQNCWDCSSAVNFWVGREAGSDIPGFPAGTYDGTSHGPSTLTWLGWIGAGVFLITRAEVAAGDIMCWQTHMGVAVSSTDMISALNPGQGTQQTPIDGLIAGEQLNTLRLHAVDPGQAGIGVISLAGTAAIDAETRLLARQLKRVVPLAHAAHAIGAHGYRL